MAITFSGLATGLDTDSIITELMAVERAPIDRLEAQIITEAQELKAYEQFNSKLSTLKDAVSAMTLTSQVMSTSASLSSEGYIRASSSGAETASFNISVAQLSQVQKTVAAGVSSESDAILGAGTITVNGTEITVDSTNNSLAGLAAAINDVAETTGVRASIINDGTDTSPYRLVFTGTDSSTSFTLASSLSGPLSLNGLANNQEAQQAIAFIDGIKVVSNSNTLTDTLSGISLTLDSVNTKTAAAADDATDLDNAAAWETVRLDVTPDTEALKEKITAFVTAYNGIMEWIAEAYDVQSEEAVSTDSDDGSTEEQSFSYLLRGDATINNMKRQLQNVLTQVVDNSGQYNILSEIGISSNLDGTLTQDNLIIDQALSTNFEDMVYLLSGDDSVAGVMKNFNSTLLEMTSGTSGMYANQKDAYERAIDPIDDQIAQLEARMVARERTLREQFSAMEQLVSGLNAQSQFLTQQLSMWNNKDS